jgi:hypothetical protein
MKYFMLFIIILILASLSYKYFIAEDLPLTYVHLIDDQPNPFRVPKDSVPAVWARAKQFLAEKEWLINSDHILETDSSLFVPYYNQSKKGVSVKIESKRVGDSVVFTVYFWSYQNLKEHASKTLALFMNKGINKYNFKSAPSRK